MDQFKAAVYMYSNYNIKCIEYIEQFTMRAAHKNTSVLFINLRQKSNVPAA